MVSDFVISASDGDGRVLLAVKGELDMASAPALRDAFAEYRSEDLTLDTAGLTFVDSTGLSVLLAANRRWKEEERSFRIANPSRPLRRLLDLAGVADAFDIEGDAVE